MEALGEKRLQPQSNELLSVLGALLWSKVAQVLVGLRRLGLNVETLRIDPARTTGDEIVAARFALYLIGNLDQSLQADIRRIQSAAGNEVNGYAAIIGIRWLDGGDLKGHCLRRRLRVASGRTQNANHRRKPRAEFGCHTHGVT